MTPDPKTAVHLDVTDARFGRLPPPIVKAAADQIVGQFLGSPNRPPPLSVRKVEVRGTDLILTGVESGKNTANVDIVTTRREAPTRASAQCTGVATLIVGLGFYEPTFTPATTSPWLSSITW